ncbi:low molecular weight phosphotyrosine protein phosphatase [Micrococcales bacterium 31B]|nr:low molecular weight phosphotyrosine protein phosphatase [Micrococcales bacterium 31B]
MTVCTGNICRSPMAEFVLRKRLVELGLEMKVAVASTGTSAEESGNPMDRRARQVLVDHGYAIYPHRARKVHADELADFDLVLAMTAQHAQKLRMLARGDAAIEARVRLWRSFDPAAPAVDGEAGDLDVEDPWYGDLEDFEVTLAQCESAVDGIVSHVQAALAARR